MAIEAYAQIPDLFRHGLPEGAAVAPARSLEAIDVPTSTFLLTAHGLTQGRALRFKTAGGVLPAGLSASVVYYALPVEDSDALFRVSTTPSGMPVNITDAGTGRTMIVVDLRPRFEAALVAWARHIDEHLPGHAGPLRTWNENVTRWNAVLAAYDLVAQLGLENPIYAASGEGLRLRAAAIQKRLDAHAGGLPLIGPGTEDQTADVAEAGATAWGDGPRGWVSRWNGFDRPDYRCGEGVPL